MRYSEWVEVAALLGLPIAECMERISYREFLVWQQYLENKKWNADKTDYYLMQVALLIAQSNSKKGKRYKLSDFEIKFRRREETKSALSSKQIWLAALESKLGKKNG